VPACDTQLDRDFGGRREALTQTDSKPKASRARRIWRRIGLSVLVLVLASAAGLSALLYSADAEFVAGALSRLTGRHVVIGAISFVPGANLGVEIERLRVTETAAPDALVLFEVERARGRQAWPRLLAGQLLPLDWQLERPVLSLRAPEPGATDGGLELSALPRLGLTVTDGEVSYRPRTGEPWLVSALRLETRRAGLGRRVEGDASARIARGKSALGELALRFAADRSHVEARGSAVGIDLALLPQSFVKARGTATGTFDLAYDYEDASLAGKLDLDVAKLSVAVPELSGPIAPTRAKFALDVDWKSGVLALGLRPLALDDLVATGTFTLDSGSPGRVALDVQLADFEPGRRDRLNALTLLGMKIDTWRKVASRIEAGTVADTHLVIDVPRTTAGARLSFDAPLAPEAFQLELNARDGIYLPDADTRLENMNGRLEIRGNLLQIHGLRMTADGEPTPDINVSIDGLDRLLRLPDDEDEVEGGPGTELVGLEAAIDGLVGDDSGGEQAPALAFSELALRYPAFVLPLREASGVLRFPSGGILSEGARGVLGGAPAELDVKWEPAADRVDVAIRYLEAPPGGQPITGPTWFSGRIALDSLDIGELRPTDVQARVDAVGTDVRFSDVRAAIAGGALSGSGSVALGEAGRAPFAFDLEVRDFDAAPVATAFELPDDSVVGRGKAAGRVAGVLRPGGRFATEGELDVRVELENGSVAKLPGLVALARLPSLSGVSGLLGRPLPYDTLTLDFNLAKGQLGIADAKLLGSQLRMLGSGEMDLNTPTKESDFVVALLFLQTLDSVIGSLPIVRNVMLGKDRNLLALYFHMYGPRDDMFVTPLAPERVRDIVGFASSAVMKGVRTLGKLIPGAAGEPPPEDEAEPTPAPSPAPP
jgi:hypothetical protein